MPSSRRERILGHDDSGRLDECPGLEQGHALAGVPGSTELAIGADLHRDRDLGAIGQVSGVVFHVDDHGIDLGRLRQADELVELPGSEGPGIDVDRPDRNRIGCGDRGGEQQGIQHSIILIGSLAIVGLRKQDSPGSQSSTNPGIQCSSPFSTA
jgi:hypothetical protein